MGETKNQAFQLSFNKFLRIDFQESRVTSDGGLVLVRELDERQQTSAQKSSRGTGVSSEAGWRRETD